MHIDEAATWSDGTPVTAQDVEYSVLRYASPVVANTTLLLYAFEGTDDALSSMPCWPYRKYNGWDRIPSGYKAR